MRPWFVFFLAPLLMGSGTGDLTNTSDFTDTATFTSTLSDELDGGDYSGTFCVEDLYGASGLRCGALAVTGLPTPTPEPPHPEPGDEPPGEALVGCSTDLVALAAGMASGDVELAPCSPIAAPGETDPTRIVLADSLFQLATYIWNEPQPPPGHVGSLVYAATGENKQVYDRIGRCWRFFGGGHADSNLNHVIRLCLDPFGWSREWGPATLAVYPADGCVRPTAGPPHPGHMWNASEWLDGERRMVLHNFMSFQSGSGCELFPKPEDSPPDGAREVWSYDPYAAGGPAWTKHGRNDPDNDGAESRNTAALPDGTIFARTKRRNCVVDLFDDAGNPIHQTLSCTGFGSATIRFFEFFDDVPGFGPVIVSLSKENSGKVQLLDPVSFTAIVQFEMPPGYDKLTHWGVDLGPDGALWLLSRVGEVFRLDPITGTYTQPVTLPVGGGGAGGAFVWRKWRWDPTLGVFLWVNMSDAFRGLVLYKP